MKIELNNGAYYEIREKNSSLYQVFYCWGENLFYSGQEKGERMMSRKTTFKQATETAREIKRVYEMNFLRMG